MRVILEITAPDPNPVVRDCGERAYPVPFQLEDAALVVEGPTGSREHRRDAIRDGFGGGHRRQIHFRIKTKVPLATARPGRSFRTTGCQDVIQQKTQAAGFLPGLRYRRLSPRWRSGQEECYTWPGAVAIKWRQVVRSVVGEQVRGRYPPVGLEAFVPRLSFSIT